MADVVLTWERFDTFRKARERFRRKPCIYVLTDAGGTVLRVGESDDLWQRYFGGTGWMVDTALHGSENVVFGADASADRVARRRVDAALIFRCQPAYCVQNKLVASTLAPSIEHQGDVPLGLR